MALAHAEKLVLTTLKQVMEEKISTDNVEVCVIPTATKKMVYKTSAEIKTILDGIE